MFFYYSFINTLNIQAIKCYFRRFFFSFSFSSTFLPPFLSCIGTVLCLSLIQRCITVTAGFNRTLILPLIIITIIIIRIILYFYSILVCIMRQKKLQNWNDLCNVYSCIYIVSAPANGVTWRRDALLYCVFCIILYPLWPHHVTLCLPASTMYN